PSPAADQLMDRAFDRKGRKADSNLLLRPAILQAWSSPGPQRRFEATSPHYPGHLPSTCSCTQNLRSPGSSGSISCRKSATLWELADFHSVVYKLQERPVYKLSDGLHGMEKK